MKIASMKDYGDYLMIVLGSGNVRHTFRIEKGEKTEADLKTEIRARIRDLRPPAPITGTEVTGNLALLKDEDF